MKKYNSKVSKIMAEKKAQKKQWAKLMPTLFPEIAKGVNYDTLASRNDKSDK